MIDLGIEHAPAHLRARIEKMRARIIDDGQYRRAKRGSTPPPWVVSTAGARCALLLDEWLGGLHHLPSRSQTHDIDWSSFYVEIVSAEFYAGLSSFDGNGLTRLVVLSHEHAIRSSISGATMGRLSIALHPRSVILEGYSTQHTSLQSLIEQLSKRVDSIESSSGALNPDGTEPQP